MSLNLLDRETSPYLLQHKDNPVHWRAWNDAALAEAKATQKPILLSVGYAACHWCHVMAHESFEDPQTADLINRLYIPIKVDREERPDLDLIYQSALSSLGQQGGWPLTMFLSPAGEPFWGGTYFPPTARYGRPAFRDLLNGISETYEREPAKVTANIEALRRALAHLSNSAAGPGPSAELLDLAAESLFQAIDPIHGGLSGAPKFPQVPLLFFLQRAAQRTGNEKFSEAVARTLDHMSQGGIYDHLGGGFARYSTDESWLVPHFEKMLYDNAALVDLLTAGWRKSRSPLYARRVLETVGWLKREMTTESGAFAASLDADSDGSEGKFYVWQAAEIDRILATDHLALFKTTYDVTDGGNWDGANILHRNHRRGLPGDEYEPDLDCARALLLAQRETRIRPGLDDKVLTDWNGMTIAALAHAAFAFGQAAWLAMAENAFAAIRHRPDAAKNDDRLVHSMRLGRRQGEAMLDDYAQMSRAALLLYQVTGRSDYLQQAERWVERLDRHYWDETAGGYFLTADTARDVILRSKTANDLSTPSGNGVMVEVLARLFHLTGKPAYRQRADQLTGTFSGHLERRFPTLATLLNGWELLENATQAVVIGRPGDRAYDKLLGVLADSADAIWCSAVLIPGKACRPIIRPPASGPCRPARRLSISAAVLFVRRRWPIPRRCARPSPRFNLERCIFFPVPVRSAI